jgi:hypothetical protein
MITIGDRLPILTKEELMPFAEQDKALISDIVEAFTIALVEICQTYEHQNKLNSAGFTKELNYRISNLPSDTSGNLKKSILANIVKVAAGEPYVPRTLFETYDTASRKAA